MRAASDPISLPKKLVSSPLAVSHTDQYTNGLSSGLLLFWYLQFAQSCLPQIESRDTLNALIDEGLLEVEDLRLEMKDWPQSLPLAVTAELLSDSTVWKCKI